nr:zinc finger and SCAN domain-containing protein 31-like [Pogona vitticeps]
MEEEKNPQILHVGSIRELQNMASPGQIKREPEEELQQSWEIQWQEFLRMLQAPCSGWEKRKVLEEPRPWDDAKAFLASFEHVASTCRWPRDKWVTLLLPALSGDTRQALGSLSTRDKGDYEKVKAAILEGEATLREKQRQHFRQFCYQDTEGPRGVYSHLRELCCQWLRIERHSKEEILELLILEQFLTVLPQEMQSWVRDRGPGTCTQAVLLAEDFLAKQNAVKLKGEVPESLQEVAPTLFTADGRPPSEAWNFGVEVKQQWEGEEKSLVPAGEGQVYTGQINSRHPSSSVQQDLRCTSLEGGRLFQYCNEGTSLEVQPRPESNWRTKPEDAREVSLPRDEEDGSCQEETRACNQIHHCHCGQTFKICACLRVHERSHTGGLSCSCPVCQNKMASVSHLTAHARIHPGGELHRCLECGRDFCSSAKLREHERIHTGEKPYQCSMCHKRFTFTTNLIAHERIHTGEKPYKCLKCGKHFRQKGTLKTHENTHLVEKPYRCSKCEKSFRQKGALTQHEKIHLAENVYTYMKCGKFLPAGKPHNT